MQFVKSVSGVSNVTKSFCAPMYMLDDKQTVISTAHVIR